VVAPRTRTDLCAGSRWSRLAGIVIALSLSASSAAPIVQAAQGPGSLIESAVVVDSPFSPDRDGIRDKVYVDVRLVSAASMTVTVRDFADRPIRVIATAVDRDAGTWRWSWNGRDGQRRIVPDGPYRFSVTATDGSGASGSMVVAVAKAPRAPYPPAPGAITVVLNPGHGGRDPGAVYGGIKEEDMVLDTALRLREMLEASGIRVVMTRSTDRAVNDPPVDAIGDGDVSLRDELAARNDVANLARADLYVTLMDNAYGCRCVRGSETWTNDERTWSPEAVAFASLVQSAHIRRLEPFRSSSWYPIDRGVRFYDFYVVRPYRQRDVPRPSLMPSVMTESLFMDHSNELAVLAKWKARGQLAVAFFEAITDWLARRAYGLRYEVIDAPDVRPTASTGDYRVEVTNTGNATSAGWVVEARVVPAVPLYDGSPAPGTLLASVPFPDGIAPGAQAVLHLDGVPLPAEAGDWLVKLDVRLPSGKTLGWHGVVGPQLPLTTVGPETPPPSPEITPEPAPGVTRDAEMPPDAASPHDVGPEVVLDDLWIRPAPGWSAEAWRGLLRRIVRAGPYGPDEPLGHHHDGDG